MKRNIARTALVAVAVAATAVAAGAAQMPMGHGSR